MAQQGKGKGFAVVLSMVAIAGVVAYVLYRRYKKKKDEMPSVDSGTTFTPAPTPTSTGGGSGSSSSTSNGNPFATKDDLIKFQQWVINTKGDKTILGKGGSTGFGDDGIWGSNSAKAFAKYGSEYKNSTSAPTSTTPQIVKGSIKSTENGVNVWQDLEFRSSDATNPSLVQTLVKGTYLSANIPSGSYLGEATGVVTTDSKGVLYREVVPPTDSKSMFKNKNGGVINKVYISAKKTTKW